MKTICSLLLCAFAGMLHAQTYTITDLGPLAGAPTYAMAINENGVIAGYAQPDGSSARAWIWKNGVGLTDVGSFGGLDNRGLFVGPDDRLYGTSQDGSGVTRGFVWNGVTLADLGSIAPGDPVFPQGVNASGTIAGYTTTGGNTFAFRLSGGTMTALGTLPGAPMPASSSAYDINDAGQIVGVASWNLGGTRAFRTDAGGMLVSLGTLGANDSFAYAISAGGDVVGDSVTGANATHAFLFTDAGGMKDLGVLTGGTESHAYGINDMGDIVGSASDSVGNMRAILWRSGSGMRDINDLIPPNSGAVVTDARDINGSGDIVGFGTIGGAEHAFLIEPFTGPDTFAPVAVATITPPSQGATVTQVAVTFWDNEKVVTATAHSAGAIRITGPNAYDMPGTAFTWTTNDSQRVNATFNVPAPGGSWDPGDNGTYEVRVVPNRVSDLAGNLMPGQVIATFTVGMQTTPTFNISGLPTTTTTGTPVNLTLSATGSYPAASGDVFAFTIDWDGDGTNVQTVNGTTNTVVAHTFTSTGARTVHVRATDPHGVLSTERTANVSVTNSASSLASSTVLATANTLGNYSAATVKNGTMVFFGQPTEASTSTMTWDYLTAGSSFTLRAAFDNGPIQPAAAAVDARGRILMIGGYELSPIDGAGPAVSGVSTYTIGGGLGGGVAALPTPISAGPTTTDNLSRNYLLYNYGALYRYTAGASGAGVWDSLPAPAVALSCMSFDGGDRIVGFAGTAAWAYSISGNVWTSLGTAPAVFTRATLGADGLVYLVNDTQLWVFDPVLNTFSQIAVLANNQGYSFLLRGTDGFVYFIGGYGGVIERFDTRATATIAPRIASTPTGTTIVQGNAWAYTVAASGKPRPTFSLVHAPAGMTIGSTTGIVAWTPALAQAGAQTAVVRATNSAGFAEQMITFNVLAVAPDLTAPSAPTNIVVGNITLTSADVAWSPSTDNIAVVSYGIFDRRVGGSRYVRRTYYPQIASVTGTAWHTPALAQGSTKTYYVASFDAAGNRSSLVPFTFTLLSTPSLYANSSGTFSGARAIVSEPWTGNVITATGNPLPALSVTAAPAGAVWHSTAGNTGYFTWTAAAGQEGDAVFTLQASNGTGNAVQSYHVTVYPAGTDLIPPNPVTGVTIDQVSWNSARVTWQPATDNYGVVSYQVTVAHRQGRSRFHRGVYRDDVHSFNVPATTLQITADNLWASTGYTVTVLARDAAGLASYAWSSSGTTFSTRPQPFVLPNVSQTANLDGSLTMTWPGSGYYWQYTVECTDSLATPNWLPVEPASQWPSFITTFTVPPPPPGVPQRFYRVKASPFALP